MQEKKLTAADLLTVIRAHCLDCSGGSRREVHNCNVTYCNLYPYRKPEKKKEEKVEGQMSIFDMIGGANDKERKRRTQTRPDGRGGDSPERKNT